MRSCASSHGMSKDSPSTFTGNRGRSSPNSVFSQSADSGVSDRRLMYRTTVCLLVMSPFHSCKAVSTAWLCSSADKAGMTTGASCVVDSCTGASCTGVSTRSRSCSCCWCVRKRFCPIRESTLCATFDHGKRIVVHLPFSSLMPLLSWDSLLWSLPESA